MAVVRAEGSERTWDGAFLETAAGEPFGSRVEVEDGAVDCSGVGSRLEMFAVK